MEFLCAPWIAGEIVDPLDGTTDFVKERVGFAMMIGLAVKGRPALAYILTPRRAAGPLETEQEPSEARGDANKLRLEG